MKAILAGINLKKMADFDEKMEECRNLCQALGLEVVLTISQTANSLDPNTGFRKGKLEELKVAITETKADEIVFMNSLSASTIYHLEDYLDIRVIDRTALILDIFSQRAHSKEALIQTEMARLKYNLPKMLRDDGDSDRMRGGVNNRGAGENRVEIISRQMERRIGELKKELDSLKDRREEQGRKRNRSNKKKVALVGYTNAGKSSLMNRLLLENDRTGKSVYAKDQLFATLDTAVRNISYKNYDFLLFDTVGFVSDLPHELIEAFSSTLEAVKEADLLLHVLDCSNSNYENQREITLSTLKRIGADEIPILEVYNKCDLLKDNKPEGLLISCLENIGIDMLLQETVSLLYPRDCQKQVLIPYQKLYLLDHYASFLDFSLIEHLEEGTLYEVAGAEKDLLSLCNNL